MPRVKKIWKKFNLKTNKKRPVLLERDSRWSFSLVENVILVKQLKAIPLDTLATERSIRRECAATVNYHDQMISQLALPKKSL